MAIKKSEIENRFIPLILFLISVIVSALKVFTVCDTQTAKSVCDCLFARLTQGSIIFLCAWYGYESWLKGGEK